MTRGQERLRLSVAAHGSSNEVARTRKGVAAGSACGVSAQTIAAAVSVEIFTLFLSGGASREEDKAAEDGWGSGERSECKKPPRPFNLLP